MKTAMQELIDELKYQFSHSDNHLQTIVNIVQKAQDELLEKEKEQIKKAFSDGQETPINHPTLPHYSRDEYYEDNYNKN